MSKLHRINLSTAWEPPADGSRTWVRRFGRPSGVETGDRVWLVVEGHVLATLVLNGVCLPSAQERHDVTDLLESRNELLFIPSAVAAVDEGPPGEMPSPAPAHGRRDLDARHGGVSLDIETGVS